MLKQEFHNIGDLEEIQNDLARASRYPLFVDPGQYYNPESTKPISPTEELDEFKAKHVVWNEREQRPAYIASDEYDLVQHREVIDLVRGAVQDTVGEIDKGVIRDYGERIDGTVVFGNQEGAKIDVADLIGEDYVVPEGITTRDELGLGMRFSNSFDGTVKVSGSTMGYRYICQNWMVWGEKEIGSVESAHIGEIDEDFFSDIVQEVFETRDELSGIVVDAEHEEIPTSWVSGILSEVGFGNRYAKRIGKRVLEQDRQKEDETTMWRVYNAVTSELDHEVVEDISRYTYNGHQSKAWSLLTNEPRAPSEEEELEEFVEA